MLVLVGMKLHRVLAPLIPLVLVVALVGCAVQPGSGGDAATIVVPAADPSQEVSAFVTVIDDGSGAALCPLVLESYPPQCGDPIPVDGWSWDGLEGIDQVGDVRWGFYRVFGLWHGDGFTVTLPPEWAAAIDPLRPDLEGDLTSDETATISNELDAILQGDFRVSVGDGIVLVEVRYDDRSLQSALDQRYGDDHVTVMPLFEPFDLS